MIKEFLQTTELKTPEALELGKTGLPLPSPDTKSPAPSILEDKQELKGFYDGRYEAKYVVHPSLIPQIRDYIRPFCELDEHCRGSTPEYTITTLQLDSTNMALHYAKLWDFVDRFKLRVRTYDPIGSSPVFMEVKAKFRTTVVKYRSQIPF